MNIVENKFLAEAKNRRGFLRNIGLATAAAGVVAATPLEAQTTTGPSDVDILNFALNLEYLEAEFYTMATSGLTISSFEYNISGSGTVGPTTGGSQVAFTDPNTFALALELADDERTHVALLQSAITSLGGTPVAKPAIKLPAFSTQAQFLTYARAFEEVGVSAYGGAAPLISSKTILGYAARILAAEAEHVGYLRAALIAQGVILTTLLDNADIPTSNSPSNANFTGQYFSLNSSALSTIRTPGQVLFIAYGNNTNSSSGGFFPNGVNGNITESAGAEAVTDGATFSITNSPIQTSNGSGSANLVWNVTNNTAVTQISIRLGSPAGPYFIYGPPSGSMSTPNWVTDGQVFYLQNASNLATEQTGANTLAIAIARSSAVI